MEETIILEEEMKFYESKKEEWLKEHENEFVLIKGKEVVGFFSKMGEAYAEGVERYGNQPFFIKQVRREIQIEHLPTLMLGITHANI